jgi:hypothetical protein
MNDTKNDVCYADDNPLDFGTDASPFWEQGTEQNLNKENTEMNDRIRYDEVIPKEADWHDQSLAFTMDWLKNIQAEHRKSKKTQKRGMPYKRTLKNWSQLYGENDIAEIVRQSRKIMDVIIK